MLFYFTNPVHWMNIHWVRSKETKKASGYNELIELKLWEGSNVTWGANESGNCRPGNKSMSSIEIQKKVRHFSKIKEWKV
jgi:hypothetical protein